MMSLRGFGKRSVFTGYVLSILLSGLLRGDTIAVSPSGGVAGTDTRPFVIGWEFSVSASTAVTGLAYLDATGGGLAESHMVGIFNSTDGALLVSATVPAGSNTVFTNGFRVVPVTYTLAPGTYVIGGLKTGNGDYAITQASTVVNVPGVSYIQERELQTSTFTMPTTNFALNEVGAFGPSFTVASAAGAPLITGISNGASFQPVFAPNTYVSIFGLGLASATRTWTSSDFTNGTQMPTALNGLSVTINGTPAYVEYISPTQLNVITPGISLTGTGVPLTVAVPGQQPVTSWLSLQTVAPALFTWQTGTSDSGRYLVAQHSDYSNVGKAGLFPSQPASFTTPARPGETIILYGTGFGPTTPAIAPGIVTDKIYPLSPLPTASVGNLPAQVEFAGLIPSLAQVYQINITIPTAAPSGDLAVALSVNGDSPVVGLITVGQ